MFLFFVCFCCFFLFNNPISSSICKLPIRSEIYNCTFKNTNKVSIIIINIIIIIITIIIIIIVVIIITVLLLLLLLLLLFKSYSSNLNLRE